MISKFITAAAFPAICCVTLLCTAATAFGQEGDAQPVHWAYGAFFGSGYYKFGDSPGVTVVRLNLRRDIRQASLGEDGRRPGITLRLPVTIGHQGEIASAEDIVAASLDTISFVPGVEITIPISEKWTIKPLASVGYGWASGGDDSAWIYRAGISTKYAFASRRFQWSLINELILIGYGGSNSESQQSMPLTLGLEASIPLRNRKFRDDPVQLHWHIARTQYLGKLEVFEEYGQPFLKLDSEWEFGAAFGKVDQRIRFWKLSWDRVGFGIRVSNDGDLTGFRLNFRSLFDR